MRKLFLFTACSCFLLLGTIRYKPPNVTVSSKPDHYTIEIKSVQNTTAFGYQYVVKTTQNENALLQTNLENKFTVGERLLVHGTFVPIAPPKNPTDFDFRTYMRHKGVSRKLEELELLKKAIYISSTYLRYFFDFLGSTQFN
ncbi:MAG: DUF4131 domain-containing protein [Flavobacteriaceae bacterium]